ncbi:hypothetical protein E2C01_041699 [Portunus trituberculatus]|uniref:Uncharacterized protein n=1 Tax=Portunus trituberculatus TaxID=210409 RepID=A0A5B7FSJ5_PORTR|nr:hypothetical protein [Portunus trituberculatus]
MVCNMCSGTTNGPATVVDRRVGVLGCSHLTFSSGWSSCNRTGTGCTKWRVYQVASIFWSCNSPHPMGHCLSYLRIG